MCIRDRDNTAQALGVQTESTVEAVKKASTTKEALKKLSKNETVYVIADANGAEMCIRDRCCTEVLLPLLLPR